MKSECDRDLLRIATIGNRKGFLSGSTIGNSIASAIRSFDPSLSVQLITRHQDLYRTPSSVV